MNRIDVNLQELIRAAARLKEALGHEETEIVRDATIQRFEFTIELSWKVLQRYFKASGLSDPLTPRNIFREAGRLGLITDTEAWLLFLDARNSSSHSYREDVARTVYSQAKELPEHVAILLERLGRELT